MGKSFDDYYESNYGELASFEHEKIKVPDIKNLNVNSIRQIDEDRFFAWISETTNDREGKNVTVKDPTGHSFGVRQPDIPAPRQYEMGVWWDQTQIDAYNVVYVHVEEQVSKDRSVITYTTVFHTKNKDVIDIKEYVEGEKIKYTVSNNGQDNIDVCWHQTFAKAQACALSAMKTGDGCKARGYVDFRKFCL
jgi:hypothetical protein